MENIRVEITNKNIGRFRYVYIGSDASAGVTTNARDGTYVYTPMNYPYIITDGDQISIGKIITEATRNRILMAR